MDAKTLTRKLRGLSSYLEGSVKRGLQGFGDEAVDLNVAQMEIDGKDSRGGAFGDYSVASYEMGYPEEKSAAGKQGGFINLNFTGDFHGSMDFRVTKGGLDIFATDDKTELLVKHWGKDIFGLNDKNFDLMFDDIAEHIARELTTYFT